MRHFNLLLLLLFSLPLPVEGAMAPVDSPADFGSSQHASAASGSSSVYSVVTPATLNKKKTETTLKKLQSAVPGAEIKDELKERNFYRLVVKCFNSLSPAKSLQTDLLKLSKSTFIIQTNNSYCVAAGSQLNHDAALAEQKQLAKKHISATIVKLTLPLPHWQVKLGDYSALRDAIIAANNLSNNSDTAALIKVVEPITEESVEISQIKLDRLMSQEILNSIK